MEYTIKLADGTRIEHLSKDKREYVSETAISESLFEGNMASVEVIDETSGEVMQAFKDAYLIINGSFDPYRFRIADNFKAKDKEDALQAQLEIYAQAIEELAEMIGGGE